VRAGDPPRALSAYSDEQLVELCRKGDGHAWGVLVDRYKALVYSVPVKFRLPPEDAADVFQNVWLDLHAELGKLREPAALRGWLVSVATHKCLHWKQRRLRQANQALGLEQEGELMDTRPSPSEIGLEAERDQLLRDGLATLPERCRQMLRMLFFEHPPRPYAEVARELGLAEGSIGFIRGRCLQKLRKALEKRGF
jgi:RNA polymerase sigma factor (sigma-70 family)